MVKEGILCPLCLEGLTDHDTIMATTCCSRVGHRRCLMRAQVYQVLDVYQGNEGGPPRLRCPHCNSPAEGACRIRPTFGIDEEVGLWD